MNFKNHEYDIHESRYKVWLSSFVIVFSGCFIFTYISVDLGKRFSFAFSKKLEQIKEHLSMSQPFWGVKEPQLPIYKAIHRGVLTLLTTGRGTFFLLASQHFGMIESFCLIVYIYREIYAMDEMLIVEQNGESLALTIDTWSARHFQKTSFWRGFLATCSPTKIPAGAWQPKDAS